MLGFGDSQNNKPCKFFVGVLGGSQPRLAEPKTPRVSQEMLECLMFVFCSVVKTHMVVVCHSKRNELKKQPQQQQLTHSLYYFCGGVINLVPFYRSILEVRFHLWTTGLLASHPGHRETNILGFRWFLCVAENSQHCRKRKWKNIYVYI